MSEIKLLFSFKSLEFGIYYFNSCPRIGVYVFLVSVSVSDTILTPDSLHIIDIVSKVRAEPRHEGGYSEVEAAQEAPASHPHPSSSSARGRQHRRRRGGYKESVEFLCSTR